MAAKYLDYAGLQRLVENIDKKYAPIAALIFKSTVEDIAHLPALNTVKAGWMYNITIGGGTTDDFVEGAGHVVADGENVAAVELITGYTVVASPAATDDPKALGWYEVDTVVYNDVTASLDPSADPSALGLYEEDSLTPGTYVLTADTSIQAGKSYYEAVATYKLSQDRIPDGAKTYYTADAVMKWDLLGGIFDLEGKYLEFGQEFPQGPANRMVEGRTFLYMGDNKKVYTYVTTPEGRPSENGYFEGVFTAASTAGVVNPSQIPLYEETAVGSGIYARTTDSTVDGTKTYYEGAFTPSTDTTVDPAKNYYTEGDLFKKGAIYQYDATNKDWNIQSSGGSDMIPITIKEVDDLFI